MAAPRCWRDVVKTLNAPTLRQVGVTWSNGRIVPVLVTTEEEPWTT